MSLDSIDYSNINWRSHFREWHDTYISVAAMGSLFLALLTLGVLYKQFDAVIEQNTAIWYSTRPYLMIQNLDDSDIQPYIGNPHVLFNRVVDSTNSKRIVFKIRNMSNTGALIDRVQFQVYADSGLYDTGIDMSGVEFAPTEVSAFPSFVVVPTSVVSAVKMTVSYRWDVPSNYQQTLSTTKCFEFVPESSGNTRVIVFPQRQYDSLIAANT